MKNGKHGEETYYPKMGADSSAENSPNAPEFICPICLTKSKSSGFQWEKASLGLAVELIKSFVTFTTNLHRKVTSSKLILEITPDSLACCLDYIKLHSDCFYIFVW